MDTKFQSTRLVRALGIAWLAYVAYIMGRKPVSITRSNMSDVVSATVSGYIDTAFLATYSVGQFVYVSLRGRVPIRSILLIGLLGSASCVLLFGATSSAFLMVLLWGANGLFQSIGWPTCIAIVTPWIGQAERGWIMGVWGSCQAVGGILGNWLCAYLLGSMGWRGAYYGDAVAMGMASVIILLIVVDHPNRAGFVSPAQMAKGVTWQDLRNQVPSLDGEITVPVAMESVMVSGGQSPSSKSPEAMSALKCLRVPGVLGMSMSYFCQKIVRYTLLFWLPFFLTKELGYDPVLAGYTSAAFDVGGVLGSVLSGVFSDWYAGGKRRVMSCVIFILSGLASLLLFSFLKPLMVSSISICCIVTGMIGFFFFGCDTLMTGATLQDMADRCGIPEHTSSLSGVVGGVGSVGAVLQGALTTAIALQFGWGSMFYFLCALAFVAAACMATPVRLEREHAETKVVN
eukprot:PhM_4_TR4171/c2_g1_i1/m.50446/K13783/SLC37A1_2; MFS transporter, OPA family, solute carrier family 37 (glycerol-3-phosphate transporter), member 1/2